MVGWNLVVCRNVGLCSGGLILLTGRIVAGTQSWCLMKGSFGSLLRAGFLCRFGEPMGQGVGTVGPGMVCMGADKGRGK